MLSFSLFCSFFSSFLMQKLSLLISFLCHFWFVYLKILTCFCAVYVQLLSHGRNGKIWYHVFTSSIIVWQNLPVIKVLWTSWFFIWRLQNYLGVPFKKLFCFRCIIRFVGFKLFMVHIIVLMSTGIGHKNAPFLIYDILIFSVFSFLCLAWLKSQLC